LAGLQGQVAANTGVLTYAIAGYFPAPTKTTGSIADSISVFAGNPTSGTRNYAILSLGDVIIASNKKLILEGTLGAIGDTYLVYDSAGTTMDFFVDGNERLTIQADGKVGIGVSDPHSKLEVAGAISSGIATITGDQSDYNVSGINTLFVNPSAGTSITGFTGGVAGQVLFVSATANGQDITMVHNSGTQKVFLHTGASETLSTEYGGWTLTCDGSDWYDTEHSKHA